MFQDSLPKDDWDQESVADARASQRARNDASQVPDAFSSQGSFHEGSHHHGSPLFTSSYTTWASPSSNKSICDPNFDSSPRTASTADRGDLVSSRPFPYRGGSELACVNDVGILAAAVRRRPLSVLNGRGTLEQEEFERGVARALAALGPRRYGPFRWLVLSRTLLALSCEDAGSESSAVTFMRIPWAERMRRRAARVLATSSVAALAAAASQAGDETQSSAVSSSVNTWLGRMLPPLDPKCAVEDRCPILHGAASEDAYGTENEFALRASRACLARNASLPGSESWSDAALHGWMMSDEEVRECAARLRDLCRNVWGDEVFVEIEAGNHPYLSSALSAQLCLDVSDFDPESPLEDAARRLGAALGAEPAVFASEANTFARVIEPWCPWGASARSVVVDLRLISASDPNAWITSAYFSLKQGESRWIVEQSLGGRLGRAVDAREFARVVAAHHPKARCLNDVYENLVV